MTLEKFSFRFTPCGTCPYRKDVPSGIWHESEYLKLVEYDQDTSSQPMGMFLCHGDDRRSTLCRGWYETHGEELLAVRLLRITGRLVEPQPMGSPVECFATGREAAVHGMRCIRRPGAQARKMIAKLLKQFPELTQ